MDNLWSFLYQTLAVSVTAAVLLIAKWLFLSLVLSPRMPGRSGVVFDGCVRLFWR